MSSKNKYVDEKKGKASLNLRLWNDFRHWVTFHPEKSWGVLSLSAYDQLRFKKAGKDPRRKSVTKNTQLLIEGFRSSANSYLVRCFQQLVEGEEFWYADHHHSPAMAVRAVKLDVPVLLCIRPPLDTCVSSASRWPIWTVEESLAHYETFYSLLLPYLDTMVVTDFSYSIKNPIEIFSYLNEQFSLDLDLENFDFDANFAHRRWKTKEEMEEGKQNEKENKIALKENFMNNGDLELLQRCEKLYKKILSEGSHVLKLD